MLLYRRNGLFLSNCLIAACLAGCTGNPTEPESLDNDEDGLANALEIEIGTDPEEADTDGDGFSDGHEYSRQQESDPYSYNPLVADTAKILVSISNDPQITVDYVKSNGQSESESIAEGTAVSKGTNSSVTAGASVAVEVTEQANWQVGTQSHAGGSVSLSVRGESSLNVSTGQSEEIQKNMQEVREKSESNEISKTNGRLEVMARVENVGDITATLKGFTLSASLTYPGRPGYERMIGGLNYDNRWGEFPPTTLKPGDPKDNLPFTKTDLNLETVEEIINCLADGGQIKIRVATNELIDPNDESGRPLDRVFTDVLAKAATVTIDYGPEIESAAAKGMYSVRGDRSPAEVYHVATYMPDGSTPSAADLLKRLDIKFETGTTEWSQGSLGRTKLGLLQVRDCKANAAKGGYWIVGHTQRNSTGQFETKYYNPLKESLELEKLAMPPRSTLQLVYVADHDHDRVGDRTELQWGTNPLLADTDGDGLNDGDEVDGWKITIDDRRRHVTSHPLKPDTDGDGTNDYDEKKAGTDPASQPASKGRLASKWRVAYSIQLGTDKQDRAEAIGIDKHDNIYIAGDTWGNSFDGNSWGPYMIAKYNSLGERQWVEQYRNAQSSQNTANLGGMAVDAEGNVYTVDSEYVMAGSTTNSRVVRKNFVVANKFSTEGKRLWKVEIDDRKKSDAPRGFDVDREGNSYIGGYTQGTVGERGPGRWSGNSQDAFLAKVSPAGKKTWVKQWMPSTYGPLACDPQGNTICLARTGKSLDEKPVKLDGIDRRLALVKSDPNGKHVWIKQFGFDKSTSIQAIATGEDGSIYLAGNTSSRISEVNRGKQDAMIIKYDADGNRLWTRQIGSVGDDYLYGIYVRDGIIYVAGTTRGEFESESQNEHKFQNLFAAAYSADGKRLLLKQLHTGSHERAAGLVVDSKGDIYVFGSTNGSFNEAKYKNRGKEDLLLIKLSPAVSKAATAAK